MRLIQNYDPRDSAEVAREKLISSPPRDEYGGWSSLDRLAELYGDSVEWLSQFFKVRPHSRFARYEAILASSRTVQKSADICELLQKDEDFRSAFFEVHTIIEACLSIRTVNDVVEIPKKTMLKLREGNLLNYRDAIAATENDASRDTFFEIFVAARFLRNGIPIGFSNNEEDISANFDGHRIYIECKRVQSERKFFHNISIGNKQLERRYVKGRMLEFGMVFLSIDNLINPTFTVFRKPDMNQLISEAQMKLKPFTNSVKVISRYGWPNVKTVAYFVHSSFPFILTGSHTPGIRQETTFASYFHHSGKVLGESPPQRMRYFNEFERFKTKWIR